jgi:hypothetical protein
MNWVRCTERSSIGMSSWRRGIHISDEELEAMEPGHAACTDAALIVTLANGQRW